MGENVVNKRQNDKNATRKEVLTSFFLNNEYKAMSQKQVAQFFKVPKDEMDIFYDILNELEQDGVVYIDPSQRVIPLKKSNLLKCKYQSKGEKFGFALVDDGEDVYISSYNADGVMDGDDVLVEILNSYGKSREGKIVKILKRNTQMVVGKFLKSRNFGFVIPTDSSLPDIYISKKNSKDIKDNKIVKVRITKYPTATTKAEGQILEVIGNADDKYTYVDALYSSYELDKMQEWESEIKEELKSIPKSVLKKEKVSRVDRTHDRTFTIDAADAKDLDDAVSVKKLDGGNYMLSVYIADVSHYVKEGTKLNKEAITRGTSIYIPSQVIPMLPKELSNGICSLNEGKDRLTLGVDMKISPKGEVLSSNIFKGVINVNKKMSYDKVYKVITNTEDEETLKEYAMYKQDLLLMEELAKILNEKRINEGCMEFDIPEMHIVLDKNLKVEKIEEYKTTFANQIVEEFMLITNMTVAKKYEELGVPFIYRIHEAPDSEKLVDLNVMLANYKLKIKDIKNVNPKALADVLDKFESNTDKDIIAKYMLRSMKVAKYSNECLGHFGLNAKYYCHFTSPIRRYPDLFIHRIISKILDGSLKEKDMLKYFSQAEEYAKISSDTEKNATKIERDFNSLYSVIYMDDYIGQEFEATISSLMEFAMFVRLDNTIEGYISYYSVYNDEIEYDEKRKIAYGSRTGKQYKVGDKLKVRLIKADIAKRQIDFEIV